MINLKKRESPVNKELSIFMCALLICSANASAHFISELGKIQIPGLTKKVAIDLASQPLTVDDIVNFLAQRCSKIAGDLRVAGDVAKSLSIRLFKYVKENPVDASIIAGGIIGVYLITSALIRSMTATRCPCCYRTRHGHGNYIYHV